MEPFDQTPGSGPSAAGDGRGPGQIPELQGRNINDGSADPSSSNQDLDSISEDNMEFILDIPLHITVELGRTELMIHEMLKLSQGSVIELSKLAGETLDIMANRKLIAKGEVVVSNEKYGVRLTEIISPMERIERLK